MTFKPIKLIVIFIVFVCWLFLAFLLMGCSTTSQSHFVRAGMSEDAQDRNFPTKYNLMDSADGMQDPNANIKIFGVTY